MITWVVRHRTFLLWPHQNHCWWDNIMTWFLHYNYLKYLWVVIVRFGEKIAPQTQSSHSAVTEMLLLVPITEYPTLHLEEFHVCIPYDSPDRGSYEKKHMLCGAYAGTMTFFLVDCVILRPGRWRIPARWRKYLKKCLCWSTRPRTLVLW